MWVANSSWVHVTRSNGKKGSWKCYRPLLWMPGSLSAAWRSWFPSSLLSKACAGWRLRFSALITVLSCSWLHLLVWVPVFEREQFLLLGLQIKLRQQGGTLEISSLLIFANVIELQLQEVTCARSYQGWRQDIGAARAPNHDTTRPQGWGITGLVGKTSSTSLLWTSSVLLLLVWSEVVCTEKESKRGAFPCTLGAQTCRLKYGYSPRWGRRALQAEWRAHGKAVLPCFPQIVGDLVHDGPVGGTSETKRAQSLFRKISEPREPGLSKSWVSSPHGPCLWCHFGLLALWTSAPWDFPLLKGPRKTLHLEPKESLHQWAECRGEDVDWDLDSYPGEGGEWGRSCTAVGRTWFWPMTAYGSLMRRATVSRTCA